MAKNKPQPNDSVRLSEYQTTAQPKAYAGGVPVFCAHDAIVPLKDLIPNPRNPNTHPPEQIKALGAIIRATGWRGPITVSTLSGMVVKGHGRMMAAELEDMTEVPVDYQNYASEAEELADLTADNRIAELAVIDNKLLADLFVDIDTGEIPFMLSGYTEEEYGEIVTALSEAIHDQEVIDADEVVEPSIKPFSQRGDLWILGKHRVLCGDSTNENDFKYLMNGKKARMCFTDPPWNVAIGLDSNPRHRQREGLINDNMSGEDFQKFINGFGRQIIEYVEGDLYCVLGASEWPTLDRCLRNIGYHWSATVIWVKDTFVLGRSKFHRRYEPIWYGWPESRTSSFCERRDLDDVWEIPRPKKSEEHPTMKPVELVERAIEYSSKPGDLVLDAFGGSGTTLIAAESVQRAACLMELDPKYVDVIVKRYVRTTGKKDISCVRQGQELSQEVIAELFEADAEGGEQE